MHKVAEQECNRVNSVFSQIDDHFIKKNCDRKDLMRQYKDIPMPLDRLYKEQNYIKSRHGKDLQIKIE